MAHPLRPPRTGPLVGQGLARRRALAGDGHPGPRCPQPAARGGPAFAPGRRRGDRDRGGHRSHRGRRGGFLGGWTDRAIGAAVDLLLAMPVVIIVLSVLAVFHSSMPAAMVTFGVLAAAGISRVTRSATLSVREEVYVAAARVAGVPKRRIILRHVLPRVAGPVIVQLSLIAGGALLVQTGLSYLGLGAQPPAPTWGGMIAEAAGVMQQSPWLLLPSGVAIGATILAFALLGDAIRDTLSDHWAATRPGSSAASPGGGVPAPAAPAPASGPTPARPEPSRSLSPALRIEGLNLAAGGAHLLRDVHLEVLPGETVGLVGESGCGKTMTALATLGVLPAGVHLTGGRIMMDGQDVAGGDKRVLGRMRGRHMAMISQQPMTALDPCFRVGSQLSEAVRRHRGISRTQARACVIELLEMVRLPDPGSVARRYPHQLSGGMAQRVAIAMALAGRPRLLIADEPTTALDVTVQADVLDLLRRLQQDMRMSILLITHDWGVVADLCDRAVVMYAGEVVESSSTEELFANPRHPYTRGLLAANPQASEGRRRLPTIPGRVPSPDRREPGCQFAPRCGFADSRCVTHAIGMATTGPGHLSRCVHDERIPGPKGAVTA
ncbi:dipeptide/oligopeptide/nickel ABC transporter permease/ATP-binding protein [Thermocatellispora tengchongensis]|uniref:dipeptide/oligopeptide/nickel ABC transporter permease/ATP-binding protein n=1 Tax=Thermocatellispora tengchongensis TaxID=1073253 RepID=UPI003641E538